MSRSSRSQKLTVLLLKDSVKSFKETLRAPMSLIQIGLSADVSYVGEFWYLPPKERKPTWKNFVEPVLQTSLSRLISSTVSAVFFVKAEERKRIFAFTFGYGCNLLKSDCYELEFSLRVALNRINPERLRSLDLRTYEDIMVSTRKQTSQSAELGAFELDLSRDLLRAVTGEPDDKTFIRRLTGADSLTFTVSTTAHKLDEICDWLLKVYKDDRYKQHFEWVDYLREVRNKDILQGLNAQLEEAIKTRNTEKLHLAPPEIIDWQSVEAFCITGTGKKDYDDLILEEYLDSLGDKITNLTFNKLKSYMVSVRWTGSEQFQNEWHLFDCIVWETEHEGQLYALIEGRWFEIGANFAARVRKFVRSIPSPINSLPDAKAG